MDRFPMEEGNAVAALRGLGPYTAAVVDPPWSNLAPRVPAPQRTVVAGSMELGDLERLVADEPDGGVVVGVGGGSALDTAKFIAWKTGKPLVQIPTITSVDAAFTDAVGVRIGGRVRYVGQIFPSRVLLDTGLVRSAPPRLNRAGIGDVLSCHTALYDWRLAADRGEGVGWDERLAGLGQELLDQLDAHAEEVAEVTAAGVRFLASAHRRVGAACSAAGHSRFEEGSEHFLAYAYEHHTGEHHIHGELVSLCVVAMAHLQDNCPEVAVDIIRRAGTWVHPADLGIGRDAFIAALLNLRAYARQDALEFSIADTTAVDQDTADRVWTALMSTLPRQGGGQR
jgi:glycerol-1-phosphate dehydrogenase [NAD(P)+]